MKMDDHMDVVHRFLDAQFDLFEYFDFNMDGWRLCPVVSNLFDYWVIRAECLYTTRTSAEEATRASQGDIGDCGFYMVLGTWARGGYTLVCYDDTDGNHVLGVFDDTRRGEDE